METSVPDVTSVKELTRLASALEVDSAAVYRALAQEMTQRGRHDLAALFGKLQAMEEGHARELAVDSAIRPGSRIDLGGDEAAPEMSNMTPYRALAWAVRREVRAFRFYTYVSAQAPSREIRDLAERLAKEELGHAALLRAARRQAFHRERRRRPDEGALPRPEAIASLADLNRSVVAIEGRIGRHLACLSADDPAMDAARAATAKATSFVGTPPSAGPGTADGVSAAASPTRETPDPQTALREAVEWSDRAFAFYDSVVDTAASEPILECAQALSQLALERLVALQEVQKRSTEAP
jgi:rubrerythrin